MHRALTFLLSVLAIMATLSGSAALAAEPAIPNYWDERERLPKPDLSGVERLRFLTTIDFPPFSFLDGQGRLAGFHVDLAREVCRELDIVARCQIQGLPWEDVGAAMAAGRGEALIAGTPIDAQARESYLFSRT